MFFIIYKSEYWPQELGIHLNKTIIRIYECYLEKAAPRKQGSTSDLFDTLSKHGFDNIAC